jgi:hypothetical protein
MKNIENNIAPLIESQFPGFYKEDGETFVAFTKAYYEWLDTLGAESRKILEYRDIDHTVDSFLQHFKNEFLNSLPEDTAVSKPFLIKHIQDLYKSKGSSEAYKLLFRLVFGEDIEVYDPSIDIIKPSDGIWKIPRYIECSKTDRAASFLGQQVTGSISGAKAFVENVIRKRVNGRFIDVLYLSDIKGDFQTGEYVTDNNNLSGSPYIVGSLNTITVTQGGAYNAIGDVMDITSGSGVGGQGLVRKVIDASGKVSFTVIDGGYGYQNTSTVLVSNCVIGISNVSGSIIPLTAVVQPLQLYNYNTLLGSSFSTADSVKGYNSSNTEVANGYVVSVTANTTANTGNLVISITGGDWNLANTVRWANTSTVNATLVSTSNVSAFGTVLDSNSTSIGVYSNTRAFYVNGYLKFYIGEPIGLANIASTSTTAVVGTGNNQFTADVSNGDTLYFRANSAVIGVVNSVTNNTAIVLAANSLYAVSNSTIWRTHYTATANSGAIYSSGSGATFSIGSLSNTESVTIFTDLISSNNSVATGNISFLDMLISGNNSGIASNAYGFLANSSLSYNNAPIMYMLSTNNITIGSVVGLTSVNPGNNYNIDPLVVVRNNLIAGYDRPNLIITLADTNSLFSPGQTLIQDTTFNKKVLTISSNTGAFLNTEVVTQLTSGATGTIYSANSSTLVIDVLTGTFVVSNNIIGNTSGANAVISSTAIANSIFSTKAKAIIKSVNTNVLTIEPITFNYGIVPFINVYSVDTNGSVQGIANVSNILRDYTTKPMAFNADVNTAVTFANGVVTEIEVLSSGFGHSTGVELTLTNIANSQLQIVGTSTDTKQGLGPGFWKDNRGKLNSDKYIHDNKYYQEYSYEIRSKMSLNVYSDILKKLLHVSGTELFGKTIIQSEQNITVYTPGATVSTS